MTTSDVAGERPRSEVEAYLALGGNVGDVRASIRRALSALAESALRVIQRSSDYRTPAWGKVDQPAFINACAYVRTTLTPHELLSRCLQVEQQLGRVRGERWGPRTIDIDLLAYDALTIGDSDLTLPHPELLNRAFVLVPLAEIAPALVIAGTRIDDALERVDTTGIERLPTAAAPSAGAES